MKNSTALCAWPWNANSPCLNPWLALALAVTSFVSETLYGATTFGPAITFNVGWQVCYMLGLSDGTMTSVAVELTVMEIMSAALQIVILRRSIDVWLSAAIAVPLCIFTAVGQAISHLGLP